MKLKLLIALLVAAICLAVSCKKNNKDGSCLPSDITACVQSAIDSSMAVAKGVLYTQIDAYQYQGKKVYLFYAGCCDRMNPLKDGSCNFLFSPSGGISGGGDMTHPDFFKDAVKISTVWQDPRN